jgi:TonB family protein
MMIVTVWVIYCVVIAGVLGAGAVAWERAARWSQRPARWGWLAALAGAVTLPWVLRLVPDRGWEAVPGAASALRLEPLSLTAGAASPAVWSAADVGLLLWLAASVVMLGWVALMVTRLVRASRRWRVEQLDGGPVLMTGTVGPAAVGVRRGVVVLPSWVMELDRELRAMLVRHERSHVDAGDPRLLLAAFVLLAAMPWNPVAWLLVLRLRNAIELDCDARVLSAGADPARYGSLLLEVGRRRSAHALVMATFAEPRVFLEERIRRIAKWPLERRPGRAALFTATALFMFVAALSCADPLRVPDGIESPTESAPLRDAPITPQAAAIDSGGRPAAAEVDSSQPVFTPMTRRPELLNRPEVQEALVASYPPLLRDAGIGGSPTVHFFIDQTGAVKRLLIAKSSGYPALDEAAMRVAEVLRFSPAYNRDEVVSVWIEIPIIFSAGRDAAGDRAETPSARDIDNVERARALLRDAAAITRRSGPPLGEPDGPVFTPMTVRPELINRGEVQQALVRNYPPLLRDAGIGGNPTVHFFIDQTGEVRRLLLSRSSGYPALDEAALAVAKVMRFSPAQNRDRDVAVWVEIPIIFSAK